MKPKQKNRTSAKKVKNIFPSFTGLKKKAFSNGYNDENSFLDLEI